MLQTAQRFILDPLEQFEALSILPLLGKFSVTNVTLIVALTVALLGLTFNLYRVTNGTNYDFILTSIHNLVRSIVRENLLVQKQRYFNLIFYLFLILLFANMIGMIPYSFTVTSSFVVTLFLSLGHFIGINVVAVARHG